MPDQEGTLTRAPDLERAEFVLPVPGQVLGGRFRLIRTLGAGASGTVFEAHDATIDQRVALKVLRGDLTDEVARARLQREVRAARHGHENVVTVYELHEEGGLVFLAMELVDGRSLRGLLAEKKQLGIEETITIARQVAAALEHLHGLGLVHRDVKPGNILIATGGTAKLCDMGLARAVDGDQTLTQTAAVLGTPAYMAPEQASGAEVGPAADVYSLGLTLFQCLTGEVPLLEDSAVATAVKRQRSKPPGVRGLRRDCPRWLARLLRWMLEVDPRERPGSESIVQPLINRRMRPIIRWRALRVATGGLALGVVAWAGFTVLSTPETVRVEVGEKTVKGFDQRGVTTWRYELGQRIQRSLEADIDADGQTETIVAAWPGRLDHSYRGNVAAELVILSREGVVISHVRPRDLVREWPYSFGVSLTADLRLLDIDGDGGLEVLANCRHRLNYPTVLLDYHVEMRAWEPILDHPGYIYKLKTSEAEGSHFLQFLAVNNEIGVNPVFCELEVHDTLEAEGRNTIAYMDNLVGLKENRRGISISNYVLLDTISTEVQDSGTSLSDSGLGVQWTMGDWGGRLDRFGNPVPGPNMGRDLRNHRVGFVTDLRRLDSQHQPRNVGFLRADLVGLNSQYDQLLEEAPYEAALTLLGSSAMARAGDVNAAISMLESFLEKGPEVALRFEDAVFRLAHLEAVSGDLDGAKDRTIRLMGEAQTTRGRFDAPYLLLSIGIESHDNDTVTAAIARLEALGERLAAEQPAGIPLRARAHLWWNRPSHADTLARTVSHAPAGAAMACLARWRLGATRSSDPDEMTRLADEYPEAGIEARLARASANLALGQPSLALAELDELSSTLSIDAAADFQIHQLWDLARALRLRALAASGSQERAIDEANILLPELMHGLLPAVVVEEVKMGAGGYGG